MTSTRGLRWLLVAVLLVPVVELAVAIQVGRLIGGWPTVGLIAVGVVLGMVVLRREGAGALRDLRAAQRQFTTGAVGPVVDPSGVALSSGRSGSDRLLVVLAGVLLIIPGLLTDLLGLALLVPTVRMVTRRVVSREAARRGWTIRATAAGPAVVDGQIVDHEIVDVRVIDVTRLGDHEGRRPAEGPDPERESGPSA